MKTHFMWHIKLEIILSSFSKTVYSSELSSTLTDSNILYLVHAPKLLRSNPGLRKGICCTSLKELKQKIEKKFPPGSSSLPLFTDDETEVGWIVLQKDPQCAQVDDDDYLMNLAPQSLLVVGRPTSKAPTPENIFDRLLSLLRESGGASVAYNQVATNHTKMDYHIIIAYTKRCWISWQRTSIKNGIRCTTVLKWRTVWQRWVGTVGNDSSDCVIHSWSAGLQPQRPSCLVCRPLHQCADQRRVHE